MNRVERERFEERLNKFPSIFLTLERERYKKDQVALDKILTNDSTSIHHLNAVTYNLYFFSGEKEKAYELNDTVLMKEPNNIIALSNRAWFLYKDGRYTDAEEFCNRIETVENQELNLLIARADLAYVYSRFGSTFYDKAVREYEQIVDICKTSDIPVPAKYVCEWNFGLFMVLKFNRRMTKVFANQDAFNNRCLKILRDVTSVNTNDEQAHSYQAKSHARIGAILYDKISKENRGTLKNSLLRQEPLSAFKMALKLGRNDVYTLELIGRFLRYYPDEVKLSTQCLERSNDLRETSKNHHQLAMAKKRLIELKIPSAHVDRIRQKMKCPRVPLSLRKYKGGPQLAEILVHFEKAVEMNPSQVHIYYDFGLTYRQIDEHEKALTMFERITKCKDIRNSYEVSNAYEQVGFCLQAIMNAGRKTRELELKMHSAFKASVELSCALFKEVPVTQIGWKPIPTLRQLLYGKIRTSEEITSLSFLQERLKSRSHSYTVLEKLATIDRKLTANDKGVKSLISASIKSRVYDDVTMALEIITCLPDGFKAVDDNTFANVYIQCGLDAYRSQEYILCRSRLRNALLYSNHAFHMSHGEQPSELSDKDADNLEGVDIMLITQSKSPTEPKATLMKMFKEIRMELSECPPDKRIDADPSVVRHYIVLLDADSTSGENADFDASIESILKYLKRRSHGNLLVVKLQESAVPDMLRRSPSVVLNTPRNKQTQTLDEAELDFVVEAMKKLTGN